jgi:hypothetical protein
MALLVSLDKFIGKIYDPVYPISLATVRQTNAGGAFTNHAT